ncbi:MAG: hypothetical protein IJ323_00595 [Clostridia bacterium]|nr:hypothetical protein [Clostridia bacterium]
MKCNKCNQTIPDDSEFCHLCGNHISKEISYAKPDKEATIEKPKKEKKPMSKRARKALTLTLILVLSLAVIAMLVFCLVIPLVKYNHAQKLLELGKYDLAYTAFAELGDFSVSKDKLVETRYLQAVDYRKAGEYDVANSIFESLGDYKDSKTLIHIHNYTVSDSLAPTCTSKGSETIVCLSCGSSKTSMIETIAHNYVLVNQIKATCDSAGEESFSCSVCSNSYTNIIAQKTHNWKYATCSAPKTCTSCGKTEGKALGHSNNVVCNRCGTIVFNPLTYSGTGAKVINNINVPNGAFSITGKGTSADGHAGSFYVDLKKSNGNLVASWIASVYSTQQTIEKVDGFNGEIKGGFLEIDADDNVRWTITIEAVGN